MKIGIIADIHGNSFALKHVLNELHTDSCDTMICLGDIAVLGSDPVGSIALIREFADLAVLGNVDRWLVNRLDDAELQTTQTPELRALAKWSLDQLSDEDLSWLDSLPLTAELPLTGKRNALLFHGSPQSNDEVISALTPDIDLFAMFPAIEAAFAFGGHTHIQLARRSGPLIVVNPGSVGLPGVGPGTPDLPINEDVAWAEYAILEIDEYGHSLQFRRTRLDLTAMFEWAGSTAMPAFYWWASKWASDNISGVSTFGKR